MAKRRAKRSSSKAVAFKGMEMKSHNGMCKMCGCSPCCCHSSKGISLALILVGILYLLNDLGWMRWLTVSWYTVVFLLLGFMWYKK